jgi:hypothetical protein
LDWKTRFGKVLVPTVYSKVHWARRRLHPKELLSAVDVPADVKSRITGGIVNMCTNIPVLGKIRTHILRVILGERLEKKRAPAESLDRQESKRARPTKDKQAGTIPPMVKSNPMVETVEGGRQVYDTGQGSR